MDPFFKGSKNEDVVLVNLVDMSLHNTASHRLEVSISSSRDTAGIPITVVSTWGPVWSINNSTKRFMTEVVSRRHLLENEGYYLKEGELTLLCKLWVIEDTDPYYTSGVNDIKVPKNQLADDFERFLESETGTDITLCVEDKELRAHKVILIARSPVFAAMCQISALDIYTNRVVIPDLPYETLSEMLRFVYTGNQPAEEKITSELLMAADKYKIERLKCMCERVLALRMTSNTAVALYDVAKSCNAEHLKVRALRFVKRNSADVVLKFMNKRQNALLSEMFEIIVGIE